MVHAGQTNVVAVRVKRHRHGSAGHFTFAVVGSGNDFEALSTVPAALQFDDDGMAWFSTRAGGLSFGQENTAVRVQLVEQLLNGKIEKLSGSWSINTHVTEEISAADVQDASFDTGRLEGRVLAANGRPAAEVLVLLSHDIDRRTPWITRTADDGTFEIGDVPVGRYHVRAGGGDHGLARGQVDIVAATETSWYGDLDRGLELGGTLTDEDGNALANWAVEIAPPGDNHGWIDGATTDDRGRFSIPNVPMGPYTLVARAGDAPMMMWRREGVWPGNALPFVVPESARLTGAARLRLSCAGEAVHGAELRLWNHETGEGVLHRVRGEEQVEIEHLPARGYGIEVGGGGRQFEAIGLLRVAARTTTEHPVAELDEPARLVVPEAGLTNPGGLRVLHLHAAVLSRSGELDAAHPELILPPGDCLLIGGTRERRLEIRPGVNEIPRR